MSEPIEKVLRAHRACSPSEEIDHLVETIHERSNGDEPAGDGSGGEQS